MSPVWLVSTLYLRCFLPGCTTELRGLWCNPRTVVAQASHLGGSLRDLSLWWQSRQLSSLLCLGPYLMTAVLRQRLFFLQFRPTLLNIRFGRGGCE